MGSLLFFLFKTAPAGLKSFSFFLLKMQKIRSQGWITRAKHTQHDKGRKIFQLAESVAHKWRVTFQLSEWRQEAIRAGQITHVLLTFSPAGHLPRLLIKLLYYNITKLKTITSLLKYILEICELHKIPFFFFSFFGLQNMRKTSFTSHTVSILTQTPTSLCRCQILQLQTMWSLWCEPRSRCMEAKLHLNQEPAVYLRLKNTKQMAEGNSDETN